MNGPSELLTIEQAALFLNVSETSLRRWTNDGRLPCARVGKKRIRRFNRDDLVAFLDMGEHTGAVKKQNQYTMIGGIKLAHGSHLCSFYTSEKGRNKLMLEFISDGLQHNGACHLLCTPKVANDILTQLRHYRPAFQKDISAKRLVISEYLKTPAEQLEKMEKTCREAVQMGATTIRMVGNVSEGSLMKSSPFSAVLEYEKNIEERIAKKYPLVALCQYDACRHSGPEIVEVMKSHRDVFSYPPDRLLN